MALHFIETMLNATFHRNSTGNLNSVKYKVHDFSSLFTKMPNGFMEYKASSKELQRKLDMCRINSSKGR